MNTPEWLILPRSTATSRTARGIRGFALPHAVRLETLGLVLVALLIFQMAVHFEAAERFMELSARYENWELDEIGSALVILSVVLSLYSYRRWREMERALRKQKLLERELHHQAFTDSLTGLANRLLFQDRLTHAMARRQRGGSPLTLLYLDLDGFKRVNDSLGHAAGDQLLVSVGRRLQGCLRDVDTVARLGGDEFAILLDSAAPADGGQVVAERILQALADSVPVHGQEVRISGSVGIADAADADSADALMRNVDLAMYAAKQGGRSRWVAYRPEMHSTLLAQMAREEELRTAILQGDPAEQFFVQYQPIMDLETGEMTSLEALVRWRHPDRGVVPPGDFIPIAESSGLIVPLGRWVLREACRQLREWDATPGPSPICSISVNVSVLQLEAASFEADVLDALREHRISPTRLILELTETLMVSATRQTLSAIENLRSIGVRFAVDDFGTGYSSLSYLSTLPVDVIKIDRSFVSGLHGLGTESAVARTVISLARSLQLRVVAEGVETSEQVDWLRQEGCRQAQGFIFARPMEPGAVERFRESSRREDLPVPAAAGSPAG